MTEPPTDVWTTRDYPVLRDVARSVDAGERPSVEEVAASTGLDEKRVRLAGRALARRGLVEIVGVAEEPVLAFTDVSGHAYLLTGLHPDGDDAVSKLVNALRQAADQVADPEEKSRLRKLAEQVGGVSRDVLTGVLTAVITAVGGGAVGGCRHRPGETYRRYALSPVGRAASDPSRKRTFRAALRQAEELAQAAEVVTYAVKPIQLFYALSQAGRALAAAAAPHPWTLRSHGLEFRSAGMNVLTAMVDPGDGTDGPKGAFQVVTTAAGSAGLAGKAEIGALWAANPDLIDIPIPTQLGAWPAALRHGLGTRVVSARGTEPVDPREMGMATGGTLYAILGLAGDTGGEVAQALTHYPTLVGAAARDAAAARYVGPAERVERVTTPGGEQGVRVDKDAPEHMTLAEFWERQDALFSVVEEDQQLSAWPPSLVGYALPAVAGGPAPSALLL